MVTRQLKKTAVYLRSSKDRSDVSIDAQRRELKALAEKRNLLLVQEFTDIVESAKDEDRPGFQSLLRELKSPGREWTVLLMTEHTRLARNQFIAQIFKHEATKLDVEIVYAIAPDLDPITRLMLDSFMEAQAQVHSMMSKQKGLGGMRENVAQGYRAGGRAPTGYQLKKLETGAVRDGVPVTKSVLALSEKAPMVASYLKMRSKGDPRSKAAAHAGLSLAVSTLIGMEWNALTYAGHTVWNVHNEQKKGEGYKGNKKRRPREEWVIKENTHEALISIDEAEQILNRLQDSHIGKKVSEAKTGASSYLFTGLLKTPEGALWTGSGNQHYRTRPETGKKGRWLNKEKVDTAITEQLLADIVSPEFVSKVAQATKEAASACLEDPAAAHRLEVANINRQISKVMDLIVKLVNPDPALKKINELETQRKTLEDQITRLELEYSMRSALANITETQVSGILKNFTENFRSIPKERWKESIRPLVEHIVLDPETLDCCIHYRIVVDDRLGMASPRGFEPLLPP